MKISRELFQLIITFSLITKILFFHSTNVFAQENFYLLHSTNLEAAKNIIENKQITSKAFQSGSYYDSDSKQILNSHNEVQLTEDFGLGKMKTGIFLQAFAKEQLYQQEPFFQSREDEEAGRNPTYRYVWSWNGGVAFVFSQKIIDHVIKHKNACHWSIGWPSGQFQENSSINILKKTTEEITKFIQENLKENPAHFKENELVIQNQFSFESSGELLFILVDPIKNDFDKTSQKLRQLLKENNLNIPIYCPSDLESNLDS